MQEREVDCIVMQPPALGGNDIRHQRRGQRSREGGGREEEGGAERHSKYITDAPCAAKKPKCRRLICCRGKTRATVPCIGYQSRNRPKWVRAAGVGGEGADPSPTRPPCPSPAPSLKQRWWQETQLGPPLSLTLNGEKGLGSLDPYPFEVRMCSRAKDTWRREDAPESVHSLFF